jgi:tRNA A-37 threonylcarbamoyl transferase component Bud32
MPLPEGFIWLKKGGWHVAVRSGLCEMLEEAGVGDPAALAARGTASFRGRGRPVRVTLPDGSAGVLRRYLHGGLLRGITGSLFVGRPRPLRELLAAERCRVSGVRVPEVLAAMHRRVALFLHRGYILTRVLPGVRDLVDLLEEGASPRGAMERIGRETRRMHEAGVWHADLHVKNVLVGDGEAALIDFDRARIEEPVSRRRRHGNLIRFDRSLVKLGRRGVPVSRVLRLRFFRGYFAGRPEPSEAAELQRRCERSLRRHRFWWRLSR